MKKEKYMKRRGNIKNTRKEMMKTRNIETNAVSRNHKKE